MRIAMFSWETLHSISVGGVAAHVTELAAALQRCGHDVHVFTRLGSGQSRYERVHGVHYHRCPMHLNPSFVDEINGMCGSFAHHFSVVEDFVGRFDIIHAHDWLAANAMIWTKQSRGHASVLTMHSTDWGRSGNVFHNGQSERVRHQERAGAYWADRVIAVSHATKHEVCWMYEAPQEKVSVVYNGVSMQRFAGDPDQGPMKAEYGLAPMDPTVLFCGRLVHQKGPDLLMEAIPSVLHYYPAAKFVFAGDGHLRHDLTHRARSLGVEHAVRMLGHRDGAELIRLFQMADVLCVPSRNEPFGIVVLEGWSAGKPVIATMNGGPNEYVRHGVDGLKIYASADSVAWGLGTLFMDWEKARAMGRAGREAVAEHFTWDVIAAQTVGVYDALLASKAVPVWVDTKPEVEAPLPEPSLPAPVTLKVKAQKRPRPVGASRKKNNRVLARP